MAILFDFSGLYPWLFITFSFDAPFKNNLNYLCFFKNTLFQRILLDAIQNESMKKGPIL